MPSARRVTVSIAWASAAAVTFAVVSCSSFSGTNANGPVDASQSQSVCPIIYVDGITGADANDGCTAERPRRSIGAAITQAKARGANEVHVCAGMYDEAPLTLDAPIALLGSYDCTTFKKSADAGPVVSYVPSSTLSAPNNVDATLRISGAGVLPSTRIEGFAVSAAYGVNVNGDTSTSGAGAVVLDNMILAGGAANALGVQLATVALGAVSGSTIVGGIGSDSFGIVLATSSNVKVQNDLLGGLTYGIFIDAAGGSCLDNVQITNNAFVGLMYTLAVGKCSNKTAGNYVSLADANAVLTTAASVQNVRIAPSCVSDQPGCYTPTGCMSAACCFGSVFAKPPLASTLVAEGLRLVASPPASSPEAPSWASTRSTISMSCARHPSPSARKRSTRPALRSRSDVERPLVPMPIG